MFSLNFVSAQSHNPGPNSNCKLNKNYRPNIEKISCPACELNDKKEKVAKVAEDKRRSDVVLAKVRAEEAALQIAFQEEKRLKLEEAKRKKDKEIAEKIAIDANVKKNKEIAEKGQIKSNPKAGKVASIDYSIDKLVPFEDKNRKICGLKIDNVEILSIPFETTNANLIRLVGTNYFMLQLENVINNRGNSSYSILDKFGKKFKLEGIDIFLDVEQRKSGEILVNITDPNTKYSRSESKILDRVNASNQEGWIVFDSPEAVEADYRSREVESTWNVIYYYNFFKVKHYILDTSLNIIEHSEGFIGKPEY